MIADEQGHICWIFSAPGVGHQAERSDTLGIAAEGTGIAVIENEGSLCVYVQNKHFEVQKWSTDIKMPLGILSPGNTTSTILPIRELSMQLRSPFVCCQIRMDEDGIAFLCCDRKGHIRAFHEGSDTYGRPIIDETKDGRYTQLAFGGFNELFYQSKLGDIRRVRMTHMQGLDMGTVASTESVEQTEYREIELL